MAALGNAAATGTPPTASPTLSPETLEATIPCVAIVDTGGPSKEALEASWVSFRTNWPDRKFCILDVLGKEDGNAGILAPEDMVFDLDVYYRFVNRDRDMVFYQNDWFDMCDLYDLEHGTSVAAHVFVDDDHVGASLDFFMKRLGDNGLELVELDRIGADNNWIEPFDRPLLSG